MKTSISYYLIILTALVLTSCATPRMFTTLDLLRPAVVTFEPGVKNVVIVNNSVVQPYNVGHFNLRVAGGDKKSETLKFDSAALFCNASLREQLESKEFFNQVRMAQTNQNKTDNFYKIAPLDKETIKFLCDLYQADAIISLDHIQTSDIIGDYYENYTLLSALDVKVISSWSINYPDNTASSHKQFTDEFSWEETSSKNLPERYDALIDACILTGSNVAERLIPRWEKQDRYFFTPNKPLMQQAMDSVEVRNWKSAISLWKQASDQTKSYKTKFHAANNMAIAYEILGDIDNALSACEIAINFYPNIVAVGFKENRDIYETLNYYNFLKKRKEEIDLISKQLSEK